jgi:hypothetical protein
VIEYSSIAARCPVSGERPLRGPHRQVCAARTSGRLWRAPGSSARSWRGRRGLWSPATRPLSVVTSLCHRSSPSLTPPGGRVMVRVEALGVLAVGVVITAVIVVDIRARHDDPEDPVVGAAEAGPAPAMHRRYDPTSIWAYPSRRVLQLRRKGFDLHRAQLEEAAAGARKDGAHLEPIDVRREAGRRRCSSASEGPTSRDAAGAGSPGLARRPVVIDTAGTPFASSEVYRSPRGRARAPGYPAAARDPRPSAPRSSYTAPHASRPASAPSVSGVD